MDDVGRYLLVNQQVQAGQRFDALAQLFDPWTIRHIEGCGLAPGDAVWEVGAGGPSLVTWLAERVGPTGRVVASDIDTSWLEEAEGHCYQVLRHDVATDDPPDGPFDLVHARLVLVHVVERERAIAAMVSVLRPGGWIVLEEADPAL